MRPSQVFMILEDLRNSFAGSLHRKGVELSLNDTGTALDVYQQWLLLQVDLGYLHPTTLVRDAHRLWGDILKVDVLTLNSCFAELLDRVRIQNFKGFKALCSTVSDHYYPLIKKDVDRCRQGDVYAAKRLMQSFAYTSRLTLHEIDLTQQCLDDYMEVEMGIDPYLPKSLIRQLNKTLRIWLKSFDPARLHYSHGPGGVSGHGRTSLEVKYKDLTVDPLLAYAFGDPWWVESKIPSNLDRISQTIFVPKSYKTFRTISMEPATLQYMQQGVLREIDRVVLSSRFLRGRIDTHDQERNKKLAQEGSINRNYATIDLSAASDSVSYALVKELFRGTKLLRYLVATRSKRTLLPDGRLVSLKKFAPMGSALCFPVETLVFAAICQYVTWEHDVPGDYSVYGDDIIVPTQCVSDVMLILETLGFRVNREKSFYDSTCWFRESCGGEYCNGFDVTPMKVSRKYNHKAIDERLTGLYDLANEAFRRGFTNLRHFFLAKLQASRINPLFAPTSILSDNYTNYHVQRCWDTDFQKIECRVTVLVNKPKGKQDETVRLRHWFESTALRNEVGDGFASEIRRPRVSIKESWVEKPYEEPDQPFIDHFTLGRR